jgi:hypothetical protein
MNRTVKALMFLGAALSFSAVGAFLGGENLVGRSCIPVHRCICRTNILEIAHAQYKAQQWRGTSAVMRVYWKVWV